MVDGGGMFKTTYTNTYQFGEEVETTDKIILYINNDGCDSDEELENKCSYFVLGSAWF